MILETERLILRELTYDDFKPLYAVLGDSDIMKHYPYAFDENKVRNWIERNIERYRKDGFGLWAVVLKESGEMIGDCGITMQNINGQLLPEIGYHIRSDMQNKGYATEAAAECIRYGFENLNFDSLYSYMKHTNSASARVAIKNGMKFIGEYSDDVNYLTRVYCVNRKEWKMSTIKSYEERMWQAAKNGNTSEFAKLVDRNAVMVCGGYRCTGAEYAGFISDFGISDYEIPCFEIVHETDKSVQVHYIVTTTANAPENADMAGKFHVTSTWEKRDEEWVLVFNMDSRIMEV